MQRQLAIYCGVNRSANNPSCVFTTDTLLISVWFPFFWLKSQKWWSHLSRKCFQWYEGSRLSLWSISWSFLSWESVQRRLVTGKMLSSGSSLKLLLCLHPHKGHFVLKVFSWELWVNWYYCAHSFINMIDTINISWITAWIFSRFSGFLPHPKNMQSGGKLICHSNVTVDDFLSLYVAALTCWLVQGDNAFAPRCWDGILPILYFIVFYIHWFCTWTFLLLWWINSIKTSPSSIHLKKQLPGYKHPEDTQNKRWLKETHAGGPESCRQFCDFI